MSESTEHDAAALQMVKLIWDINQLIEALTKSVPKTKPWQRQLHTLLSQADRQMLILRMTEAMEKSNEAIADAAVQMGKTCRQIRMAMTGSRADGDVRISAMMLAEMGDSLAKLMLHESKISQVQSDHEA